METAPESKPINDLQTFSALKLLIGRHEGHLTFWCFEVFGNCNLIRVRQINPASWLSDAL